MSTPTTTHDEFQAWLDEADAAYQRKEAAQRLREKQARAMHRATGIPTWEHQKHAFKVSLYREAIGA